MSNPKETASAKQPGLSIDPKYILQPPFWFFREREPLPSSP